jgi:pimeloyl-ACP methyl ester carboxylesterase
MRALGGNQRLPPSMTLIEEIRHPSTQASSIVVIFSFLLLLIVLLAAGIAASVDYRMLHPVSSATEMTPENLLGHTTVVQYTVSGLGLREGWFFPGLRSAPVLILCHGYRSQRGDVLTLATTLQENQYNVFVFDFSGHGNSPGSTTMGPRETTEVLTAIAAMAARNDVDHSRIGLWGANMGGYAALAAAAADRRVRAVAVDSVYDDPQDFFRVEMDREGYGPLFFIPWMARLGFRIEQIPYRGRGLLSSRLGSLNKVPKLYIALRENLLLAQSTLRMFDLSPQPKEQWVMPQGNYILMSNDEKKIYDNTVLSFFLRRLPLVAEPAR